MLSAKEREVNCHYMVNCTPPTTPDHSVNTPAPPSYPLLSLWSTDPLAHWLLATLTTHSSRIFVPNKGMHSKVSSNLSALIIVFYAAIQWFILMVKTGSVVFINMNHFHCFMSWHLWLGNNDNVLSGLVLTNQSNSAFRPHMLSCQ